MEHKIELGKYRHFKGGEVEVLSVAHHSETLEEVVVYKCNYDSRTFGRGSIWVRPLNMFLEEVEFEGKKVKRFEKISD